MIPRLRAPMSLERSSMPRHKLVMAAVTLTFSSSAESGADAPAVLAWSG